MKILIDTHALIWLLEDSPKLSERARATFAERENALHVSIASYWEMCIKISIGKLRLRVGWEPALQQELRRNGVRWLPLEPHHAEGVIALPWHHRDPFDRLLIAQARAEGMHVLTADEHFTAYDVPVIW